MYSTIAARASAADSLEVAGAGDAKVTTYRHRLSLSWVTVIDLPGGAGAVRVKNKSGNAVTADAYIAGEEGAVFLPGTASSGKQVADPGTATNAITVGSYDWNDNFSRHDQD